MYAYVYISYDGRYNLLKRIKTVVAKVQNGKPDVKHKTFLPVSLTPCCRSRKRKSPVPAPAPDHILTESEATPHPLFQPDDLFDPEALYLGYIHPSRRFSQDLPPDPPPTPLVRPTTIQQTQTHSSSVPNPIPLVQYTPPQSPSTQLSVTPPSPTSPAPSVIPATPHASQTSYPSQTSYTSRDYDCDYEDVMVAIGDINRLSRYLFRGGAPSQSRDPTGIPVTREEVIQVLVQLREMMNRMFTRFPDLTS